MKKMSHPKKITMALTSVLALGLASCGGSEPEKTKAQSTEKSASVSASAETAPSKLSGKLSVYNWDEYIAPDFKENFEAQTGIKVGYDTFTDDETLNTKLSAGKTGYDIVVPGHAFAEVQIKTGKYQKINKEKIPNYKNLNPELMAQLAKADPGNDYLVPWAWAFVGVGINEEKVKKALGDTPMPKNAMDLIFNPDYASKLKSCGIFMLDSGSDVVPVALLYAGKKPGSDNLLDYKSAEEVLKKTRPFITKFGQSSDFVNAFAQGNYCVALTYSGDINMGAKRALEDNPNSKGNLKVSLEGGGVLFIDAMAIPAESTNTDNAHAWMNYSLDPKVGAGITNELGYTSPNKASLDEGFIEDEYAQNKSVFLSSDVLKTMVVRSLPTSQEALKAQTELMSQFKANQLK